MVSIRRERQKDIVAICASSRAAFGQGAEADIVDVLRHAGPDVFYLRFGYVPPRRAIGSGFTQNRGALLFPDRQ